jgi:tetratricopeptide (TPR) repeat protein
MNRRLYFSAPLALLAALTAAGCGRIQSKAAFKDGNKNYREENFKKAIEDYKRAVEKDPRYAEAWFYLGSANQALYRPGKESPENKAYLERAIEAYNKSLEVNDHSSANLKAVRTNTLGALTGIYSDDPFKNFDTAQGYAQQLLQDNPDDPKNLYAIANLYEKFGKIDLAEETYKKVADQTDAHYRQVQANPPPAPPVKKTSGTEEPVLSPVEQALDGAVKGCGALAAFYNKPLWEGRSRFDDAIAVLQRCTALKPEDASGYQKIATFFWDKAYRDPLIGDDQKRDYAEKGMENVDKALSLKPDYFEAIIYKGLLYRVKAAAEQNPRLRQQYLEQAQQLQKQALEIKRQQTEDAAQAGAAAGAGAAPSGS